MMLTHHGGDGDRKPDLQGELEISRNTIARGMPESSGEPVVTTFVCLLSHEAAGEFGARHSLRPLISEGR
jgi:hypothetical protein